MKRPNPTAGLRHVALYVKNLEECERFYTELMGMHVEWRPDPDNVYLSSGNDNLALHRAAADFVPGDNQRLDHIGFIIRQPEEVDSWYDFLKYHNIELRTTVKNHRDGAKSFYCYDPAGNTIQIIYHPPLADK